MKEEEERDEDRRKALPPLSTKEHRSFVVRRALWRSVLLVATAVLVGSLTGLFLRLFGDPSTHVVAALQLLGAAILLWGTLFVRGWDIQTIGGVTLTERVNQWIYKFLYCLGTAIIALSLFWPH